MKNEIIVKMKRIFVKKILKMNSDKYILVNEFDCSKLKCTTCPFGCFNSDSYCYEKNGKELREIAEVYLNKIKVVDSIDSSMVEIMANLFNDVSSEELAKVVYKVIGLGMSTELIEELSKERVIINVISSN